MVSAEIDGVELVQRSVQKLIDGARRDIIKEVEKTSKKLRNDALNHKFKSKTGQIDKSIKADVTTEGNIVTLLFYIDTRVSGIILPSGYNKGWMMNDGTYAGYRRGKISPSANTVGPIKEGWKGDDFMGRSWTKNIPQLEKRVSRIMSRMKL